MEAEKTGRGAPSFLCRPMRAGDIPACAAIEAGVPDGWSEASLRGECDAPAARLFVAEAGGAVAALAAFELACGEANLYTLATAPAFRRKGAARALLVYAFGVLRRQGAHTVFLEVRAQNAPALALYRALGFAQAGLRRGFYAKPPDDAVLMHKTLGADAAS